MLAKNVRLLFFIVLISFGLSSCNKAPVFTNFDSQAWKADHNGCKDARLKIWQSLDKQQDKLIGMGEMYLVEELGRPDKISLGARNLRNYTYFLSSGAQCDVAKKKLGSYIVIYFNATNLANEVEYKP